MFFALLPHGIGLDNSPYPLNHPEAKLEPARDICVFPYFERFACFHFEFQYLIVMLAPEKLNLF